MRRCSDAPALALTATGLKGAARRSVSTTPSTPAPSATRRSAPRFCGSSTPSSARSRRFCDGSESGQKILDGRASCWRTRATTPWWAMVPARCVSARAAPAERELPPAGNRRRGARGVRRGLGSDDDVIEAASASLESFGNGMYAVKDFHLISVDCATPRGGAGGLRRGSFHLLWRHGVHSHRRSASRRCREDDSALGGRHQIPSAAGLGLALKLNAQYRRRLHLAFMASIRDSAMASARFWRVSLDLASAKVDKSLAHRRTYRFKPFLQRAIGFEDIRNSAGRSITTSPKSGLSLMSARSPAVTRAPACIFLLTRGHVPGLWCRG